MVACRHITLSNVLVVITFSRTIFQHDNYNSMLLVQARTWDTIVDSSLYSTAMIDPYRDVGKTYNPNPAPTKSELWTSLPTASPTSVPISNIIDTTPTTSPQPPSITTVAPTTKSFCSEQQGNDTAVVEAVIKMNDSWGDGWGDTTMIISYQPQSYTVDLHLNGTTFDSYADLFTVETSQDVETVYEGTLLDGNEDSIKICLQSNLCYTVEVNGTQSEWQSEIQWDIRQTTVGDNNETSSTTTLAKGYAPTKCQFSIPDANNGTYVCSYSCSSKAVTPSDIPTIAPTNSSSSFSPSQSIVPSDVPTIAPSTFKTSRLSEYPSTLSSIIPTLVPSEIPTSISSGGNAAIIDTPTTITPPVESMKSLQPSLVNSVTESTTFSPTVTFQPTITMYPTSYMSGGNIIIDIRTGNKNSNDDEDTDWIDDDAYLFSSSSPAPGPTTETSSETIRRPVAVDPLSTKTPVEFRGESLTFYPTITGHPSAYGADFMNELVTAESRTRNGDDVVISNSIEDVTYTNVPVPSPMTTSFLGSSSASISGVDVPTFTASASLDEREPKPTFLQTGSATVYNKNTLPTYSGTAWSSSASISGVGAPIFTASALLDEREPIPTFLQTGSATVYNKNTLPTFTGTASLDDDTINKFASAKLDDDDDGDMSAGTTLIKPTVSPPTRNDDVDSPSSPSLTGKKMFESVFSPTLSVPNGSPTPKKVLSPTRKQFYDFIDSVRAPTQTSREPSSLKPESTLNRPAFSPTDPIFSQNRPAQAPTTTARPVPASSQPTASPTRLTKPVSTPRRVTTPTNPSLVTRPVSVPRRAPTPTKPSAATFSPTTTFHPTTTYYPTITSQPTATMYPTVTAFPTVNNA